MRALATRTVVAGFIRQAQGAPDAAGQQEQLGRGRPIGGFIAADRDAGHGDGILFGWVRGSSSAAAGVELDTSWNRVRRWAGRAPRAAMRTATMPAIAAEIMVK